MVRVWAHQDTAVVIQEEVFQEEVCHPEDQEDQGDQEEVPARGISSEIQVHDDEGQGNRFVLLLDGYSQYQFW